MPIADALSRGALLRRSVGGGATLLAAGTALGARAGRTEAATIPDADLAYLRLLVGAELLKADFQTRMLASGKLTSPTARLVRRMQAADRAHYSGLAALMNEAGETPATSSDIDFSYPSGSLASANAMLRLASRLTTLALGGYLGAVGNLQSAQVRLPLGQIAANEAQQVSALAQLVNRQPLGAAFASALQIDAVSTALDEFES